MTDRDLTQADTVRLAIEREIFGGQLAPGDALEEGRLASRFGVSRTPVREAITQLAQAGLITKRAHKRAVVAQLDSGTMLELFEALAELEGAAVYLSTARMSEPVEACLALFNASEPTRTSCKLSGRRCMKLEILTSALP